MPANSLSVTISLQSNLIRKLDHTPTRCINKFLKRLVDFFKPSNNRFSHQDLVPGQAMPAYVNAGLDLIDVLLGSTEVSLLSSLCRSTFITNAFRFSARMHALHNGLFL